MTSACILVKDNQPKGRIVVHTDSFAMAEDAMHELRTGIAKSTGVRLPMDCRGALEVILEVQEPFDTSNVVQFMHVSAADNDLGKDGYRIRVTSDTVEFQAATRFGFRYAVYDFLAQYCGFAWLWPGPDGEVYDTIKTLAIPVGQTQQKPAYLWRHILDGNDDIQRHAVWHSAFSRASFHMLQDRFSDAQLKQWYQRNKLGGLKCWYGHTWGMLISPDQYGQDHPDYFAQVNGSHQESLRNWTGKHGGQLCTTNPDVITLMVEKIRQFFDSHPEYDVFSISPNDGSAFCECDRCIALDVACGNPPPEDHHGLAQDMMSDTFRDDADTTAPTRRITGAITDRIFTFANQIAEQIAVSHPDKLLLLLVYSSYREPPRKTKLAKNVIAQFCVSCHQHFNNDHRQNDHRNLQALGENAGELGIYEYYDQGAWPGVIRLFPDLIKDSVSSFRDMGVRHYQTQAGSGFATNGLNLWILAKVLWDPSVDVDQALTLYCRKAFGPAADAMCRYYNLFRQCWKRTSGLDESSAIFCPATLQKADPRRPLIRCDGSILTAFLAKCSAAIERAKEREPSPIPRNADALISSHRGFTSTQLAVTAADAFYPLVEQEHWPAIEHDVSPESITSLGDPQTVRSLRPWRH